MLTAFLTHRMAGLRERWHRAGLRFRLFVQLSLAFLLVFVVFVYAATRTLNESTQEALQERAIVARLMADRMDAQLGYAMQFLQSALAFEELSLDDGDLEPEKRLLQNIYNESILLKRIYLLDASGKAVWMVPFEAQRVGLDFSAAPYNIPLFKTVRPSIITAISYRTNNPGMALVIPVEDKQGKTAGYLYGWIDLADSHAASLMYPYEPGSSGYTDLIDQKGTVLASTRAERIGQVREHAGYLSTLIENKQSVVGSCHSCHNTSEAGREKTILAFAPLKQVPWGIAVYQPDAEVFANTNELTARLGALGIVVLAGFLGLVWITMRETIRPIRILTRACQEISGGNLTTSIPAVGVGEIATLADSFEGMRRDLALYKQRTETWQRELERQVEERTAELVRYRDFLLKTNRNLTALNSVSAVLVHSFDLAETLNVALDRMLDSMLADAAGIFLTEDRETALALKAHRGVSQPVWSRINRLTRADLFPDEDVAVVHNSATWYSACSRVLEQRLEMSSIVCTPLEVKGKFLGGLFVASHHAGHFTAEDSELLVSMGWQIAVGIRNARLYEAVQRKEKELAEMLHEVIAAQEEERKRIARELHDETSQGLATLILGLDTLDSALAVDPKEAAALQQTNKVIARQMLDNIRRITADLRPSLLDDMGLVAAVAWYGEKRLDPLGIQLELDADGLQDRRLPSDLETALFRIIQEAITNVIRHAHASTVTVRLKQGDACVSAQVSDDGEGFDVQALQSTDSQGQGLGLRGMRERAGLLGGEFAIRSAPGQGTYIFVRLPM